MLYELRIYDAVAGRLPDISNRFKNHTTGLFRKHGVKYLGFLDRRDRPEQSAHLHQYLR